VSGVRWRVPGVRCQVSGARCRVPGVGCRGLGVSGVKAADQTSDLTPARAAVRRSSDVLGEVGQHGLVGGFLDP
jgi:hypothetical protein